MKTAIFLIFATITTEATGIEFTPKDFLTLLMKPEEARKLTKEDVLAMPEITVKLVRKSWRPQGFDPGTDEPLHGFPGNYTELRKIKKNYNYSFGHVVQPLISAKKLFEDPNYNASQPSVIITHPACHNESHFAASYVLAFALRNLHKHYNVFVIHSVPINTQFAYSAWRTVIGIDPTVKPLAEAFTKFLLEGIALRKLKPHQISILGFSASAVLSAYMAREIRDNTRQLIHTLICLDAFQYTKDNRFFKPVSRDDAMFVHAIHSCRPLGTQPRLSTVDLFLNNGKIQPGCDPNLLSRTLWPIPLQCSHARAVQVFQFAIYGQGNVVARQCDSWEEFSQCQCSNDKPMLVVSFPVNEQARGTFYLRTSGKRPYVLGLKGASCIAEAEQLKPIERNLQ